MTQANEQIQALKAAAEKAGGEKWVAFIHSPSATCAVHTPGDKRCGDVIKWAGFDGQKNAKAKAQFIAAANPAVILSLLAEREADKALIAEQAKRIAELEARTLSVGLPEPFTVYTRDYGNIEVMSAEDVSSALVAAGIKLQIKE